MKYKKKGISMRNFKQYILGRVGCPNMNPVILKSSRVNLKV